MFENDCNNLCKASVGLLCASFPEDITIKPYCNNLPVLYFIASPAQTALSPHQIALKWQEIIGKGEFVIASHNEILLVRHCSAGEAAARV
jgi:hypothetical protein